jgi:shikimate kinase
MEVLKKSIILIGPIGAGKTTIGRMVAEKLSLPSYSLDAEPQLATSLGYDVEQYKSILIKNGPRAAYEYRRSFYDRLVPKFLAAHDHGVLDFGGGHPVVPDREKQEAIKKAFEPYPHIFLLMPSPDVAESLSILRTRNRLADDQPDLNEIYFRDGNRTYWEIAKHHIYTAQKTPEQTCQEIVAILKDAVQI